MASYWSRVVDYYVLSPFRKGYTKYVVEARKQKERVERQKANSELERAIQVLSNHHVSLQEVLETNQYSLPTLDKGENEDNPFFNKGKRKEIADACDRAHRHMMGDQGWFVKHGAGELFGTYVETYQHFTEQLRAVEEKGMREGSED